MAGPRTNHGTSRVAAATLLGLALLAVPVPSSAGDRFSLAIGAAVNAGLSPATEQRLAIWNSPMGRLAAAVNDAQSALGMSGLVGHPYGVAIAVGFRPRLRPELISAAVASGIRLSEAPVAPIHWPWDSTSGGEEAPSEPTLEEQLSILLGRRLELR